MKLLLITATVGIVFFFPLTINDSTCLFGYLSGLHFVTAADASSAMLNHYMHCFALPWWTSIGLAIWSFKKIQKKKIEHTIGGHFNV